MTNTFAEGLLVCLGILVAAHVYSHLTSIKQHELARLRLQQLLAQSELRALRVQCEPHFLFNALQGISTLIETNPLTAQTMLRRLSSLLRAVLQHGTGDLVRLREEIAILRAYVDLEQMRLGSRLSVRWLLDPEAGASLIPQLILQPLVENAIVHGVAPAPDGGWISIEAYCRDDRLVVEIRNSVASPLASRDANGARQPQSATHAFVCARRRICVHFAIGDHRLRGRTAGGSRFCTTPTEGASGASRIPMMRALVVDDEPLARTALANLLSSRADIDEFEEAENAGRALAHLNNRPFDVLLVDIQMPEMDGLQLVEHLGKRGGTMPAIIFITAHQEHAVEAFEKRAVDYVLKPFVPVRVHDALDTAIRRAALGRAEQLLEALQGLKLRPHRSSRIAIKDKGRVVFVDMAEIACVEASGNYVLLHQKAGAYLLRESISIIC